MTFRSLDMKHYTMIIPRDHAYMTINQVAQLQCAHFIDAGDNMNRPFQLQLKRIEELAHQVNLMKGAVKQAQLTYTTYNQSQTGYMQKLFQIWHNQAKGLGIQDIKLIDYYESHINQQHARYSELLAILEKLKMRKKQLLQKIACIETIQQCFGNSAISQQNIEYYQNYIGDNIENISGICYIVGLIERSAQNRFNKVIYRISRGYACIKAVDNFKFLGLNNFSQKAVIVMYPSSSTGVLQKKIQRVMQMFCNSVTELDKNDLRSQSKNNFQSIKSQYNQTQTYIQMNEAQLKSFFQRICDISYLQKWSTFIWKQKCIYENLNKLQVRGQLMIGNIYVPKQSINKLSINLNRLSLSPTLQEVKLGNPPTAFNTNSYTSSAQQITDTYGVPRYKEINPTIFTTVTFPFFFGVMFGDIGHGLVLFALGLFIIINNQWMKKSGGALEVASKMRYMITLMGFFAFYCGWIYNDLIGFNYNFFGSCYDPQQINPFQNQNRIHQKQNCVYIFGIDPIWGRAQNQLVYVNSLKMKISVIIAIIHMTFGIIMKAINSLNFKKKIDFYFQFIPQILFMVTLFGYMDFLIIFKWLKVWDQKVGNIPPNQWAPSIISTIMNIALAFGKTGQKPDGNSNMWGERGHSSQDLVQLIILITAVLCIPAMCIPKPYLQIQKIKKRKVKNNPLESNQQLQYDGSLQRSLLTTQRFNFSTSAIESEVSVSSINPHKQEENHASHQDSGQIIVHQLIQTIQFVLGAVSNTASYLRLWALSLAHSQLAKVFFQNTLQNGLQFQGIWAAIPTFIGFWMLCWITFGVLMCMDTMECFLHSLRLHWVQFQNKFYKGDGYRYEPISVKLYLYVQRAEQNK